MKFGSNLQAHLTPEWRSQYIDYEVLKNMLYECKDNITVGEGEQDDFTSRKIAQFEENFFAECDLQLTKVNAFFAEKLAETTRRFVFLQSELHTHKQSVAHVQSTVDRLTLRRRVTQAQFLAKTEHKTRIKTTKGLKLAFSEFYLNLVLLQNYQNLFINDLEGGDRSKAMKRLRVPPLTDTTTYPKGTVFRVGLFLGMFIVILSVAIFAGVYIVIDETIGPWLVVDLYRGGFILFLFLTCLGFNIWGWRTAGVNHILIFEIDPRQHLSHQHFFEIASFFSIIWGLGLLAFLFGNLSLLSFYPALISPGLVALIYLAFLINPFPFLFRKARVWLLKRLWRLFACGFYPVEFADFWIADQLTSLVSVLLDLEFLICFYSVQTNILGGTVDATELPVCQSYAFGIRPLIACYPSFIRFVQCLRRYHDSKKWFPHLVNAGKYSTTFFRETFLALYRYHLDETQEQRSVYFYLYIASLFINSSYTLAWDIKMDWGFLDKNAGENRFLREEIVYPNKFVYYFAMVENSLIRFSWIVRVSIEQTFLDDRTLINVVALTLSILEVLRRIIWNFFRLENEHLNNCGEFRAVRDISFTPIRTDDLSKLERMMDEKDGADSMLLHDTSTKKRFLGSKKPSQGTSRLATMAKFPRRGSEAVMKFFTRARDAVVTPETATDPV